MNFLFFPLGLVTGILATLSGIGGGFLLVPLFLGFHLLPAAEAAGTAIACALVNGAWSALLFHRKASGDFSTGLLMGLVSLPFAALGATSTRFVPEEKFRLVMALVMFVMSLHLFRKTCSRAASGLESKTGGLATIAAAEPGRSALLRLRALLIAAWGGFLAALSGIGGGSIFTPLLVLVLGLSPHAAVATSPVIILFTAGMGTAVHALQGHLHLEIALPIAAGMLCGAPLGVALTRRLQGNTLLRIFALLVAILAIRLILSSN